MLKRWIKGAAISLTIAVAGSSAALAAGGGPSAQCPANEPAGGWSHSGMTGTFDKAALQRGFQVYKEVCSACHGLRFIAFRNLTDIGFSADQVKAIAKEYEYPTIDDDGEEATRTGLPSDYLPNPFPNKKAAAASNNGVAPPDLSLMAKARVGGENYIYSLMMGYGASDCVAEGTDLGHGKAYEQAKPGDGQYFNAYFPGKILSMAPQIDDDQVEYVDGTKATKDQIAKDVAAFLMWTAEPKLEERKRMGMKVVIFLLITAILLYGASRRIWARLDDE